MVSRLNTSDRGMGWADDHFWLCASEWALRAASVADVVFVPEEFLGLSTKFVPLEFSWAIKTTRSAFCCSKDDIHRLDPKIIEAVSCDSYPWANEVFVLGTTWLSGLTTDPNAAVHLGAWVERCSHRQRGLPTRVSAARPFRKELIRAKDSRPHVLIVGASGMGNVGDDLLSEAIALLVEDHCDAVAWLAGPDVDPLDLLHFDAVVVGGGGLIYASRDGTDESQNLANYLKFGPMAAQAGIPAALIGVGDQDHAAGIESRALVREFAVQALSYFELATTRDMESNRFLSRLGMPYIETGSDLVFGFADRAVKVPRPVCSGADRVALIGEWLDYPELRAILHDTVRLRPAVHDRDFDFLVMSDDDLQHCQEVRRVFTDCGATVSVFDLRGYSFESLIFLFNSYSLIITTRFHGLVIAMLAGVPAFVIDFPGGKKDRLASESGLENVVFLSGAASTNQEMANELLSALKGTKAAPSDPSLLGHLKEQAIIHMNGLRRLMNKLGWRTFGQRPKAPVSYDSFVTNGPLGPSVGLCWAAASPNTEWYGNLGDSLSAVIVGALSGLHVHHVDFKAEGKKLVAVGSIAHAIRNGEATIWGPGVSIRGGVLAENVPLTRYDVRAIRGPISASHLRGFGIRVPEVYGDPVSLLPSLFNEKVEKKYELGVIPHIMDIAGFGPAAPPKPDSARYLVDKQDAKSVVVINTWHEPTWEGIKEKLRLILSCKRILSQSFHGVVIAEAFGIPVLNFRHLPGHDTGIIRINLSEPCTTDPRIFEFYNGMSRDHFYMFSQLRNERSDWERIIRDIDNTWEPCAYDAQPLVETFPLPLAYDPLSETAGSLSNLEKICF